MGAIYTMSNQQHSAYLYPNIGRIELRIIIIYYWEIVKNLLCVQVWRLLELEPDLMITWDKTACASRARIAGVLGLQPPWKVWQGAVRART